MLEPLVGRRGVHPNFIRRQQPRANESLAAPDGDNTWLRLTRTATTRSVRGAAHNLR